MGLLDSRDFFGGPLEPRRYVEFAMSTHWYARRIKIIVGGVKIERRYFTYELLSKLLVSPLITPIVVPYIIPYITPFKEFRL